MDHNLNSLFWIIKLSFNYSQLNSPIFVTSIDLQIYSANIIYISSCVLDLFITIQLNLQYHLFVSISFIYLANSISFFSLCSILLINFLHIPCIRFNVRSLFFYIYSIKHILSILFTFMPDLKSIHSSKFVLAFILIIRPSHLNLYCHFFFN